ncbi:30S ribosomal protein S16 [Thermostichus vulcanus]|uniref:Small ribosomal subunit protein bS16 n=1 Tax=Thermostichus vulcanus str. 'Rupite' TaxID=2813851 RepID=A0ABT0CAX0_THEVL|nr:30S ribosomal protein S16 [Thermostichus vulcanus]MCJ2542864.1 30S ribosomal protein S16 [Thermostichus vulcanus str. 'Rupite']
MVKLRLKRYGKKRQPSYRIIAIESKTRREARPLEELGYYNPRTKETVLETGSLLKWLRYGAQPTDTLQGILKKAGIYNMLEAGEGGVVASIRIPAMAKPEVGIPEVSEEPTGDAAAEPEAVDAPAVTEATEAAAETVAEVAEISETETVQPVEEEPVVAAVEAPAEPQVEEAAEA